MKKHLLIFLIMFCFFVIIPSLKSMSYDGPVFEEKMPVDIESKRLYYRHDSVKWGGPGNLACASRLSIRYRDNYYKNNRALVSDTTTSHINN